MRTPLVIALLGLHHGAGVRQGSEQRLLQQIITQAAVKAFVEPVLLRLARRDVVPATPASSAKASMALDVYSAPLSLMIVSGRQRRRMMASNSLAIHRPDNEVSATSPKHSRVQLSITVSMRKSMRKRRPSVI